jgi:hypothetical protein
MDILTVLSRNHASPVPGAQVRYWNELVWQDQWGWDQPVTDVSLGGGPMYRS